MYYGSFTLTGSLVDWYDPSSFYVLDTLERAVEFGRAVTTVITGSHRVPDPPRPRAWGFGMVLPAFFEVYPEGSVKANFLTQTQSFFFLSHPSIYTHQ